MTDTTQARIGRAVAVITRYGMIDGEHHKQWVLDQVLRALLGVRYAAWVEAHASDPEYDPWDPGVAP
jgi:hypothetical protein